jgi:hypothetical protein
VIGGFNHLEKYELVGRIIPYIMEKMFLFALVATLPGWVTQQSAEPVKKCLKPPTS